MFVPIETADVMDRVPAEPQAEPRQRELSANVAGPMMQKRCPGRSMSCKCWSRAKWPNSWCLVKRRFILLPRQRRALRDRPGGG